MRPKDTFFSRKRTLNLKGNIYDLQTPLVMGILNITPDSFYDGGKYGTMAGIEAQIDKMIIEGAGIIDTGAYSSRPGAANIPFEEEWERLVPVLELIARKYPGFPFSIDTFRAGIAKRAVQDYGVAMVNDISAGEIDEDMFETVGGLGVPYVMMHMKGTPGNMQKKATYDDLIQEIISYLSEKVERLKYLGVHDIIIDPGFGFGKTVDHNYQLLARLKEFKIFELPVLIGLSRKSSIYKVLGTTPGEALNGTTVLNTIALLNGANILRVHDVKEAREAIRLVGLYVGRLGGW